MWHNIEKKEIAHCPFHDPIEPDDLVGESSHCGIPMKAVKKVDTRFFLFHHCEPEKPTYDLFYSYNCPAMSSSEATPRPVPALIKSTNNVFLFVPNLIGTVYTHYFILPLLA